jgi:hypothetical protein
LAVLGVGGVGGGRGGGRCVGRGHSTCEEVRERLQFMLGVLVVEETGGYAHGTVRLEVVVALGGHRRRLRRPRARARVLAHASRC